MILRGTCALRVPPDRLYQLAVIGSMRHDKEELLNAWRVSARTRRRVGESVSRVPKLGGHANERMALCAVVSVTPQALLAPTPMCE